MIIADKTGEKSALKFLGCVLFYMAQRGEALGFNKAVEIMKVNQKQGEVGGEPKMFAFRNRLKDKRGS